MEPGGLAIHVIVMVMTRAVATLALAVAIVGSPLAGLYCNDLGAAAMACCQDKASECNQPGKTDDCCRKVPVEKDAAAGTGQQFAGKPLWTSVISFDALVPSTPTAVILASSLTPRFVHRATRADLAPPSLSILRV